MTSRLTRPEHLYESYYDVVTHQDIILRFCEAIIIYFTYMIDLEATHCQCQWHMQILELRCKPSYATAI